MLLTKPSQNVPVSCFTVGTRHSRLGGCSQNINSSWCSEQPEGRQLVWPYHAFPVVWHPGCMVIMNIIFSNQRLSSCSPTVIVVSMKPTWDCFCERKCLQDKYSIQFCCHLCCISCTIILNTPKHQCTAMSFSVNAEFCSLSLPSLMCSSHGSSVP
jgi:hypothetical protein